jgi:hypothetical protein
MNYQEMLYTRIKYNKVLTYRDLNRVQSEKEHGRLTHFPDVFLSVVFAEVRHIYDPKQPGPPKICPRVLILKSILSPSRILHILIALHYWILCPKYSTCKFSQVHLKHEQNLLYHSYIPHAKGWFSRRVSHSGF